MAHNEKLTQRVREALAHLPDVEEKRMFRGIAFMVNSKICVSTGNDELMVRVDPAMHDELVEKHGCRSMEMKGRAYKGYIYVKEDVITRKKDLDLWIKLALEYNPKAKATAKRRK